MFKRNCQRGKKIYFFIFNEDINEVIKNLKSLEYSNKLIKDTTETVKQGSRFLPALLAPLAALLVKPVISLVLESLSGREVKRAGRGYMDKDF